MYSHLQSSSMPPPPFYHAITPYRGLNGASPLVKDLPIELLSYIFILATHSSSIPNTILAITSEGVAVPARIAMVSKHWRTVAHNTPALWTSLCATVDTICKHEDPETKKIYTFWDNSHFTSFLHLSRNYPLDIVVDARDPEWELEEPALNPSSTYRPVFAEHMIRSVMKCIVPHSSRWRSLTILTDCWSPLQAALETVTPLRAPRLENLTVMRCNDYISHMDRFEPFDMLRLLELHPETAASLRHITVRGVPAKWSTFILPQVKTLEISSLAINSLPTVGEARNILASCASNLQSLAIPNDLQMGNSAESVHLPALRNFILYVRAGNDMGLLQSGVFSAPNILDLTIDVGYHPVSANAPDAWPAIASLANLKLKLDQLRLKAVDGDMRMHKFIVECAVKRLVIVESHEHPYLSKPGLPIEGLLIERCEKMNGEDLTRICEAQGQKLRHVEIYECEDNDLHSAPCNVVIHPLWYDSDSDSESCTDTASSTEREGEAAAFSPGGTFDDPAFDSMYKAHGMNCLQPDQSTSTEIGIAAFGASEFQDSGYDPVCMAERVNWLHSGAQGSHSVEHVSYAST